MKTVCDLCESTNPDCDPRNIGTAIVNGSPEDKVAKVVTTNFEDIYDEKSAKIFGYLYAGESSLR